MSISVPQKIKADVSKPFSCMGKVGGELIHWWCFSPLCSGCYPTQDRNWGRWLEVQCARP